MLSCANSRQIKLSPAEKTLDFREIAEAPRLKKARAKTHLKKGED